MSSDSGLDIGGVHFPVKSGPKMDILSAGEPQLLQMAEARDPLVFEISAEGLVRAHGYTPGEVAELLRHYRDHMVEFGKAMQALSAGIDAAHYDPENGGYQ